MKEIIQTEQSATATRSGLSRRQFFGLAGGIAGAGLILGATGCKKDDDDGINLGSGDTGILNYAYALEQLEAAFYTQVIMTPYNAMTSTEKTRLTEIRDHEVAHREFFKAAIGKAAIPALSVNFSKIDFTSRASVLGAAQAFEDLGVSAYNGAGQLISDPTYLGLAGKIVSVEARHAAYIRELLIVNSFAANDVINADGLDTSRTPAQVLSMASAYLNSKLNANNLPTN